ncbi:type I-E CRISPR-associated endonuclease Cas1e [Desulfobacter latus]|uniref:CRISPR-associated endonuclease Cas1 n=1 Tax=Desulfobacter latus TaxID=2292 RepID=A0A850TAK4_9BACT|nr:type I-E CRISPR-associated endonuclease Cas1e [Desulfobacter latus]NWH05257.1 type I-E CRISPR-associated endonuclease Cas1 [Desulfobacter latus]
MPIFEKPPLETLTPAKERWTPIYLEHGRLEVDDSSVKWIGADKTVLRLPIATISALLLGPGTTITHAAVKACADCNTPVCWVGAEGMRFYAFGVTPTHDNERARIQAALHTSKKNRERIARRMFVMRFGGESAVEGKTIKKLMGMEGHRVRELYTSMGQKYGVPWKGRNYNPDNWQLADSLNKAISAANASLYALTTAVVSSMGYLPQLGFIHSAGTLPFVFDIADIYKPETTLEAAFQTIRINPKATEKDTLTRLKQIIEQSRLMYRMPKDISRLLAE